LSVGPAALLAKLFGTVLGIFELPRHDGQAGGQGVHVLRIGAVVEVAERVLNVLLDAIAENVVRMGNGLDGVNDAIPRSLEDAAKV
jgi:hypothetical protein